MSTIVQRRRGTTAEHTTFTGAVAELTVDTTKDTVVVHDGATAGGYPLLREDGSNSALALGSAGTPSLKFTGDPNTGLYSPGADQVAISTGGTERARIDSSGRLLVGTSSATNVNTSGAPRFAKTQIEHLSSDTNQRYGLGLLGNSANNGTGGGALTLTRNKASTSANAVVASGDELGSISFSGADGTAFVPGVNITAEVDGTPGTNNMPGRIVFSTTANGAASPTERLRIDSAGTTTLTSAAATAPLIAKISTTEVARIDSSGRLLVGTSTARDNFFNTSGLGGLLQVEGADSSSKRAISNVYGQATGTGPIILMAKHRGSAVGGNTVVVNNDECGTLAFLGSDGTEFVEAARIRAEVDGTPGANDMPGRLVFSTTADGASSPTERMRIDSSGNVGIGRAPTNELDVYRSSGTVSFSLDSDSLANGEEASIYAIGGNRRAAVFVYKNSILTNPNGALRLDSEDSATNYLWTDNSDQLRISLTSGNIGTTSGTVVGTQTSDERLKNILGPVEYGLDTIKQIEPVRYALKTEPDTEKLGFIAQQVLPIVPQSVFDTGEEIEEGEPTKLGMEYVALIPVLVNAIKELSAEVDALKAQLQ